MAINTDIGDNRVTAKGFSLAVDFACYTQNAFLLVLSMTLEARDWADEWLPTSNRWAGCVVIDPGHIEATLVDMVRSGFVTTVDHRLVRELRTGSS